MKRVIISIAAAFLMSIPVFASDHTQLEAKAKDNFRKEFPRASRDQWTQESGYFKVSFVLNDVRVIAFFDEEGILQGYVSAVFLEQLPIAVRNSIERNFAGATVVEIYEITNQDVTRYKISIEYKGETRVVYIHHDGRMEAR